MALTITYNPSLLLELIRFQQILNYENTWFLKNYFLNFFVFVCYQKSWSTENTFRSTKNTFQSISIKEKFDLVFRKVFSISCVCFPGSGFWKITFQTFLCLFVIRKVDQWKTLSSKTKIWLGFQESVFLKNLGGKHFPEVVKNLKMSLFADYIKIVPQTFDCYTYFVLNIYFSISSLKILFLY